MAMVLCTVPLRGGRHVSEAAEDEHLHDTIALNYQYAGGPVSDLGPNVSLLSAYLPGSTVAVSVPCSHSGASLAFGGGAFDGLLVDGSYFFPSVAIPGSPSAAVEVVIRDTSTGALYVVGRGASFAPASVAWASSFSLPVGGAAAPLALPASVRFCSHPGCIPTLTCSDPAVAAVSGGPSEGWSISPVSAGTATLTLTTGGVTNWTGTVTVSGGTPASPPPKNPPPTPDATPDVPVAPADTGYLEASVDVNGQQQRLRVSDPHNVLPAATSFTAEYVDGTHGDHNFFITYTDPTSDVELRHYYNLTLASGGQTLSQLDGPIELWFEAIAGIDAPDAFISRVTEGADAKLAPEVVVDADGVTWIKVLTDHFSPYALTDLLSADEKKALAPPAEAPPLQTPTDVTPKHNVTTGDFTTQITVAGLGMMLVLALGIMLRLITNKRKFEE